MAVMIYRIYSAGREKYVTYYKSGYSLNAMFFTGYSLSIAVQFNRDAI